MIFFTTLIRNPVTFVFIVASIMKILITSWLSVPRLGLFGMTLAFGLITILTSLMVFLMALGLHVIVILYFINQLLLQYLGSSGSTDVISSLKVLLLIFLSSWRKLLHMSESILLLLLVVGS